MIELSHQLAEVTCTVLRTRRQHLNLSQDTLAQRTGLARTYISDVERGARHPTLHNLTLISSALEWSTSDMVRQTEIEVTKLLDPERVMLSQVGKVELTALERDILHYITKRMSDGVMITAPDGAYIVYNEKAKLITGISEPHRAGPDFWVDQFGCFREDRVTPYVPQELPLVKAMQGQATDHATMFLRNPKIGDGRYIDISARQIKDPQSGAVKGTVVVFGELSK